MNEAKKEFGAPILKIEGLGKAYGSLQVLKGIDFEVDARQVVVVIGPSGSSRARSRLSATSSSITAR